LERLFYHGHGWEIDNGIEGLLADGYGLSRMAGTMDKERLEFKKQYVRNLGAAFDYKSSLENGI